MSSYLFVRNADFIIEETSHVDTHLLHQAKRYMHCGKHTKGGMQPK